MHEEMDVDGASPLRTRPRPASQPTPVLRRSTPSMVAQQLTPPDDLPAFELLAASPPAQPVFDLSGTSGGRPPTPPLAAAAVAASPVTPVVVRPRHQLVRSESVFGMCEEDDADDCDITQASPYKPPATRVCHLLRADHSLRRSSSVDCMCRTRPGSCPVGLPVPWQQEKEIPSSDYAVRKQELLQPHWHGESTLPTVVGSQHMKCISPETLAALIRGDFRDKFSAYYIVDCRFPFEYHGGHIKGAINVTDDEYMSTEQKLRRLFFENPHHDNVAIIFHCEFSQKRGPAALSKLRTLDREINKSHYPHIFYNDVYLLEGGYHDFFPMYKDHCDPPVYVTMLDKNHAKEFKQCKILKRAKRENPMPLRRTQSQSGNFLMSLGKVRIQDQPAVSPPPPPPQQQQRPAVCGAFVQPNASYLAGMRLTFPTVLPLANKDNSNNGSFGSENNENSSSPNLDGTATPGPALATPAPFPFAPQPLHQRSRSLMSLPPFFPS
eukprot:TRINITY_DN200_c0_g2_i1.p2 TRINITY_DN200_c0_g2~~TRINITY_DN200_c0_g2_i1.p2  ORF type:complete len:494 (-),score=140.66 TRINITY_DN200_c0_g2_i1:3303-4784(-)